MISVAFLGLCESLFLQVHPEPSIGSNTTAFLGNIASLLGQATYKCILLNAFTMHLKPPHAVNTCSQSCGEIWRFELQHASRNQLGRL
jgi:hypothetical protein